MKQITIFSAFLFIFLIVATPGIFAQDRVGDLDRFFTVFAKNREFNGNILVAEKGRIVYERSFGYSDVATKTLNNSDTVFPIASITKTFTAVAILQQVEKGRLRLDEPAASYLPDFPYPQITIRHLLSHMSGLPPYDTFFRSLKEKEPARVFTNADFLAGVNSNKKELIYQPGEGWNYDNVNFIVLALILEKVSGSSYPAYIEKHILKPAGMRKTRPFHDLFDPARNHVKGLVISHLYPRIYSATPVRADTVDYVSRYWKAYKFAGFGEYVSTTHDLMKYDRALYSGKLVAQNLLDEAFTPQKLNNGKLNHGLYGLGWTIAKDDSLGRSVLHTGGSAGLNCVLYHNIDKRQTVIAFDIAQPTAAYIAGNAVKILAGQTVARSKVRLARTYGRTLADKGVTAVAAELDALGKDTVNYELDKDELIAVGYDFLADSDPFRFGFKPRYPEALEVFRQCTLLFPEYWNCYDSYGDTFARMGEKELAIKMYKRSLELKPDSESGIKALRELTK